MNESPFIERLESALNQAERRFVTFKILVGWAKPFPRTGCAPSAPAILTRGIPCVQTWTRTPTRLFRKAATAPDGRGSELRYFFGRRASITGISENTGSGIV